MTDSVVLPPEPMRLRFAGKCRVCGTTLSAGTLAVYDRSSKTVTCSECFAGNPEAQSVHDGKSAHGDSPASSAEQAASEPEPEPEPSAEPKPEIFAGVAGASARQEGKRRSEKREAHIRVAHPKLGGLILALSEDPQSIKAWEVGARGEEKLGRRLDGLKSDTVHVLHDRGIPGTKSNIDHIVVCPSGVFVIDAKKYKGKPSLRVEGGILRERTEKLMVRSRDCTKLVGGVQRQKKLVREALAKFGLPDVPVTGMLCFVEADWPLFGGDFTTSGTGIQVLWPKRATEHIRKPGPIDAAGAQHIFRALAQAFPVA